MEIIQLVVFVIAIFLTLDFIVDTIEAMSGHSKEHLLTGQVEPNMTYQCIVVIVWIIWYLLIS